MIHSNTSPVNQNPSAFQRRKVAPASTRDGNHRALILIFSFAIVLPYLVAIYLGSIKLTPVKILLVVLFVPAIGKLLVGVSRGTRHFMASDIFATLTGILIVAIPLTVSGGEVLVSSISQSIEFLGTYLIGRAFFYGERQVRACIDALKIVTVTVVALGVFDLVLQQFVAHDLVLLAFPPSERPLVASDPHYHRMIFGVDTLRAASTFDHPILFGSFCAAVLPIYLYSPVSSAERVFYCTVCIVGCLAALSSAPLLAVALVAAIAIYDRLLRRRHWRWRLLICGTLLGLLALFVVSNNPLSWLFRNFTLDPQTSYFRLLIWEAAIDRISSYPWFGSGFAATGNDLLDYSIDCLWLAKAVTYGLPMTACLFLTALFAVTPIPHEAAIRRRQPIINDIATAFSLVLLVTFFISMTVYFWNAMWLFAVLCVSIRVSLKERFWIIANLNR